MAAEERSDAKPEVLTTSIKIEKVDSSYEDIDSNYFENVTVKSEPNEIEIEIPSIVDVKIEPVDNEGDVAGTSQIKDHRLSTAVRKKPLAEQELRLLAASGKKPSGHMYEIRPFQCEYCRLQFKNIIYLTEHVKEHGQTATKRYKCRICEKQFKLKINMNLHMIVHSLDGIYKCDKCEKIYTHKQDLVAHITVHDDAGDIKCSLCGQYVIDSDALSEHIKNAHLMQKFSCTICSETFATEHMLAEHSQFHTKASEVSCTSCGESFSSEHNLRIHESLAHNVSKDFTCSLCNKSFLYQCRLKKHLETHSKEERFECSVCYKLCPSYGVLATHSSTHFIKPPFECTLCPMRFYANQKLDSHMKRHTQEKPYACKYCGKRLASKSAFRLHLATHEGRNYLSCEFCGTQFSQKASLFTHLKRQHNLMTPYVCHLCGDAFEFKKELEKHTKMTHHGVKLEAYDAENSFLTQLINAMQVANGLKVIPKVSEDIAHENIAESAKIANNINDSCANKNVQIKSNSSCFNTSLKKTEEIPLDTVQNETTQENCVGPITNSNDFKDTSSNMSVKDEISVKIASNSNDSSTKRKNSISNESVFKKIRLVKPSNIYNTEEISESSCFSELKSMNKDKFTEKISNEAVSSDDDLTLSVISQNKTQQFN